MLDLLSSDENKKQCVCCVAAFIARIAHGSINQLRKYTKEPYFNHVDRVARKVASVTKDPEIIAAAYLHDVLEDVFPVSSFFSHELIKDLCGERVLNLVLQLTDVSKKSDGKREERKRIDREHLKSSSNEAKLIKLCDLIDNSNDIKHNDPGFYKVFKKEALLYLDFLGEINDDIFNELSDILKN